MSFWSRMSNKTWFIRFKEVVKLTEFVFTTKMNIYSFDIEVKHLQRMINIQMSFSEWTVNIGNIGDIWFCRGKQSAERGEKGKSIIIKNATRNLLPMTRQQHKQRNQWKNHNFRVAFFHSVTIFSFVSKDQFQIDSVNKATVGENAKNF